MYQLHSLLYKITLIHFVTYQSASLIYHNLEELEPEKRERERERGKERERVCCFNKVKVYCVVLIELLVLLFVDTPP